MTTLLVATCLLLVSDKLFAATGQVTLTAAGPGSAEPGLTTVRLTGSGFPSSATTPANIQVTLAPSGGGATTVVTANQIQAVVGTTKRVGFLVPFINVAAPTVYQVSIADSTDGFASSNSVPLTINPLASISLVNPNSGAQGQSVVVSVTGAFSNFLTGTTQVTVGGGITVGSVTVSGPTALTAQFTVPVSAGVGPQTVTVTTGAEVASSINGFAVTAGKVAVPNVVGGTQAAAATSLAGTNLLLGTVTTASSTTVASGNVISESPAAGTSANVGSAVNIVVSTGSAQVSVPNVVGLTQAAATTSITGAGLVPGTVTTASSSTVASGNVISESPAAGTSVNVGSAVNIVVSTGPAQVSVPNVVGLTQAAATTSIAGAGLVLGTVTTASSSTVASGNVISESPVAGTSVNVGSAVNIVASTGPAQVSVPNVVADTQAAATSALTAVGLTVGTVTTQPSATFAVGAVISESPVAGTLVNPGSAVNLVISSGGTTGPASIVVTLSAQVVAPDGSVTVTPVALDSSGNPVSPQPTFAIQIVPVGNTSGNAPVLNGNTITFPKLVKKLLNQNVALDPNGLYADTDPTDPNYGEQTGGVYQVTASLASPSLVSPAVQVAVIPSSSATITAQVYNYASQLNNAVNQVYAAYGNTGHTGITAAKATLATVLANVNFGADVLQHNHVLAPPDGQLITPDLLTGFTASPDDAAYTTKLATVIADVQAATAAVNAMSTTAPTMAQVLAIQAAAATYKTDLAALNALHPSTIELANVDTQFNELYSLDIPTMLDAIAAQVNAMAAPFSAELKKSGPHQVILARNLSRMHIAPQLVDIFFVGFGAAFDLESQALNNIITLSVALIGDIINLEAKGIINKNAPPGMTIDDLFASSSLQTVSPCYAGTEVDGFGFDPNPANDPVIVIGAINGGNIGNLATLSIPKGIGQAITLVNTLISTGKSIGDTFNIKIVQTPDQFVAGGGLFGDGADALIFNNGWPQTNQSPIPANGLVVVTNTNAGTFQAVNVLLIPGPGSCPP